MIKEKKKKNIKIAVAYHVPFKLLKTDVYVPIHAGRDVAFETSNIKTLSANEVDWLTKNLIGDNTGDNMSKYNRYINEMSVVYWMWKQQSVLGNPDYVGLNHYRRHFILNEKNTSKRRWFEYADMFIYRNLNHQYKNMIDEKYLYKLVDNYDILATKEYCVKNICAPIKTIRDFIMSSKMSGVFAGLYYDKMESIIREKFPQYVPEFEEMNTKCEYYFCNMFLMRKDLFDEYCNFVFSVINELLDVFVLPKYGSVRQARTIAFMSEYLTSIFILNYRHKYPQRVKELDMCCIVSRHNIFNFMIKVARLIIGKMHL